MCAQMRLNLKGKTIPNKSSIPGRNWTSEKKPLPYYEGLQKKLRQSETRTGYSLNKWKTIILKMKRLASLHVSGAQQTPFRIYKKGDRLVLHQIHGRDSRGSVLQTYLSVRENTATWTSLHWTVVANYPKGWSEIAISARPLFRSL